MFWCLVFCCDLCSLFCWMEVNNAQGKNFVTICNKTTIYLNYVLFISSNKMNKLINFSLLGIIIILLFVPLPVPVENMEGARDKDNFIYGGIYWTSIKEQISFGNYVPLSLLFIPCLGLFISNKRRNY